MTGRQYVTFLLVLIVVFTAGMAFEAHQKQERFKLCVANPDAPICEKELERR